MILMSFTMDNLNNLVFGEFVNKLNCILVLIINFVVGDYMEI